MHRLSISGPTLHAYYLTEMMSNGFETIIVSGQLTNGEASPDHILSKFSKPVKYLLEMEREINWRKDWKTLVELRKIIRQYQPHIVHTHAAKAGALGRIAAMLEGVPIRIHTYHGHVFHSYFGKAKTAFYKNFERLLAKISTGIVVISPAQYEEIVNRYRICKPSQTHVIPLGFDFTRFSDPCGKKRAAFRREFDLDDDTVALCIAGRLTAIKNHRFFLQAVAQLLKVAGKPVKAFIVGDGELKEDLLSYCGQLGLDTGVGKTICFTSWRYDMESVFNGIDICCLSSLNEGTPVTAIESMYCGKPVVSTRVGGVPDVVVDEETGFLVAVDDLSGYVTQLSALVNSVHLRAEMGEKARQSAERYDVKYLIKHIEDLYYKLLLHKGIKT